MFRLIKLSAYLLLGYTLYQLVLGVLEGSGGVHPQAPVESSAPPRQRRSPSRSAVPTRGGSNATIDGPDGSHRRQSVGRGVVSR